MKSKFMLLLLACVTGCSYPVKPTLVQADIASGLQNREKIQGVWKIELSERLTNRQETIVPYTLHCSGMKYPLDVGSQLSASLQQTTNALVERTAKVKDDSPTDGVITFDLENFGAKVGCFAFLRCVASSQIGLRVTARDKTGNVLTDHTIQQSSEKSGFEGLACEGVATILSDSVSQVITESLQGTAAALADASKKTK